MASMSKMATSELVIGLKNKDEAAFSVLYDDYAPALLGVAFRMVNNKSVSEEILQDVFVKIWKHIDTYDESKGTLFTWMFNITRNTCKDYFRSSQYRYRTLMAKEELDNIPDKYTLQTTSKQMENLDLDLLVQKLGPKYKDIIDLVYVYGYSQEQVSEKLNIPLGTIKTRSRIALKWLKGIYTI